MMARIGQVQGRLYTRYPSPYNQGRIVNLYSGLLLRLMQSCFVNGHFNDVSGFFSGLCPVM